MKLISKIKLTRKKKKIFKKRKKFLKKEKKKIIFKNYIKLTGFIIASAFQN